MHRSFFSLHPLCYPVLFFALSILAGGILLHLDPVAGSCSLSWLDAFFTATSATCVTGLAVVDTGATFGRFGQSVILVLIQAGGLGIMTLASLALYLFRQRVSLTDRIAVGQNLLHDASFRLGRFLVSIVLMTLVIESAGVILLLRLTDLSLFAAVFHAVSAFCNAGFSLFSDSLSRWQGDVGVNLVFMILIILGGMGFSVLADIGRWTRRKVARSGRRDVVRLSWYSRVVLQTSLILIVAGWLLLFLAEYLLPDRPAGGWQVALLSSLFQSVTCRTAGFNTVDIGQMTNVSLLVMMLLMWVGGAPGSTAGGIKVTTFRVMTAFFAAQFRGRRQAVINGIAAGRDTMNRAIVLTLYSLILLAVAVFLLDVSETGGMPAAQARGMGLSLVFEAVSALGTTGLSTGLTGSLSGFGKLIIMALMFVGRLGPLIFLAIVQDLQKEEVYFRPEGELLIG